MEEAVEKYEGGRTEVWRRRFTNPVRLMEARVTLGLSFACSLLVGGMLFRVSGLFLLIILMYYYNIVVNTGQPTLYNIPHRLSSPQLTPVFPCRAVNITLISNP